MAARPDICQFLGTIALFSPVKVHQKVRKFAMKLAKMGQTFVLFVPKKGTDLKNTPPPMVTNISYDGCS